MPEFLQPLIQWLESSKYIVLFTASFFEGPVTTISSGFLIHLGTLDLIPAYIALVSGDFCGDLAWYTVGYFGANPLVMKYGHYVGITPELVTKIEGRFKKHQNKIIFISKITMGLGFALATLIVSGLLRVPLKKFSALILAGGIVWIGFLLVIGYVFGNVYSQIQGPMKIVFIVVVLAVILVALHQGGKHLKKLKI